MQKLLLKSKKKKAKNGAQFRTFFTDVMILVKGEEEKGKQKKTLTVKFDKTVNTSELVRGYLTVDDKDIDLPFKYQVLKREDGSDSYPVIYIHKYEKYEEKRGNSTITFLTEEDETEETAIDEDEVEEVEDEEVEEDHD
ncbi:MAG: hypothetical protein J6S85_21885 [Methanobrevibacter sp.]|nr:hypothetical protein [Methanobrevibacter sp.]